MNTDVLKKTYETYMKLGSQKKTAKELGVDVRTIQRRIKRYDSISLDTTESVFERECRLTQTPEDDVSSYWIKTEHASIHVKRPQGPSYEEIRSGMIEEMKQYAPKYPQIVRPASSREPNLLVVDPADVHIGKLVDAYSCGNNEYDIEKAVKQLVKGVISLTEKAKGFYIDQIVFVIGNDILHIDNVHNTTTKGTKQDTHGKFWHMFLAAKQAYIKIIEHLTAIADVTVVFNPSNHDYTSGWMLADSIYSWFNNNKAVKFGANNHLIDMRHRKYVVYGSNLLGFTHGDGAAEKDLATIMQYEARQEWGTTKFAYMYAHHLHHKIRNVYTPEKVSLEKDLTGVTVLHTGLAINPSRSTYIETIRSPSPPDEYHAKFGYLNAQAVEAFVHSATRGQVARFTEFF